MPRNPPALPDPASTTTIGQHLAFTREATGAAGVRGAYVYPPDPDGPFAFTAAQLSAGSQAALVTILNEVIALYKAQRNYV